MKSVGNSACQYEKCPDSRKLSVCVCGFFFSRYFFDIRHVLVMCVCVM